MSRLLEPCVGSVEPARVIDANPVVLQAQAFALDVGALADPDARAAPDGGAVDHRHVRRVGIRPLGCSTACFADVVSPYVDRIDPLSCGPLASRAYGARGEVGDRPLHPKYVARLAAEFIDRHISQVSAAGGVNRIERRGNDR
jgi:hypothetical protein